MKKIIFTFFITMIVFLFTCFFIIKEGERGIILRFGKILYDDHNHSLVCKPGLHIKFPFIETVKMFDARIYTTKNESHQYFTKERKDLIISTYIKWKICDFGKYYLATRGNLFKTEILLKNRFNNYMNLKIRDLYLGDIIQNVQDSLLVKIKCELNTSNVTRNHNIILKPNFHNDKFLIMNYTNRGNTLIDLNSTKELGIKVMDIQISKMNLSDIESNKIYDQMKAKFKTIIVHEKIIEKKYVEKIRQCVNYEIVRILSEFQRQALVIKSESEAIISKLFLDAFSKEPEFYNFIRTLQVYEKSFKNKENFIIIDSNYNNLFRDIKIYK